MVLLEEHSTFGGSSAKRWGQCPGSITFASQTGPHPATSEYAEEGTLAHSVAEKILSGWAPPSHIDQDMVRYGRQYAAGVNMYKDLYGALGIEVEKKVISNRYPDVGGTIDALIDARRARTIVVIDYKYGAGIPVSPVKNEQLMFYGALALESLLPAYDGLFVGDVTFGIFQPRGVDTGWKDWSIPGEDLFEFKNTIYQRVENIKAGDTSLKAGEHCRFCEAKPVCPTYFKEYIEPLVPRTPIERLTNAQIHDIYKKSENLSSYIKQLGEYIKTQCVAFGSFESYVVGTGKGQTSWLNPIQIQAAFPQSKYPGMYKTELKTPKQTLELYPNLKQELEGQYKQIEYPKLITNETPDYTDMLDDE